MVPRHRIELRAYGLQINLSTNYSLYKNVLHIEKELAAIIALMKTEPKIDSKNIFAIGFSNGGGLVTWWVKA